MNATAATEIVERRESAVRSYCRTVDAVLDTASGSVVRDVTGNEYIDFLAGAGALNYGHNHPVLRRALIDYIERDGIAHGLDIVTAAKADFMSAFEEVILEPRGLGHRMQFTGPTGADAVEAALKLARKVTGRNNVIAFTNAFHGMTQGALSATGNRHHRGSAVLGLGGVTRMPYDGYLGPDIDTSVLLRRMLDDPSSGLDAPAAILLETVQGEGGLNVASPDWLREIVAIGREAGALLIVDDVQAGCGRTGTFFSFEPAGIRPDVVILSKSLSGYGLPLSMLLLEPEHDVWLPGENNGTFRGNAHAFITASAALREFWVGDAIAADVERRAALVRSRLDGAAALLPGSRVKGRGMMLGLDVRNAELASRIRLNCILTGLIIECCGARDEVVKVMAPLTTPDDLLDRGLSILRQAILDVVAAAA